MFLSSRSLAGFANSSPAGDMDLSLVNVVRFQVEVSATGQVCVCVWVWSNSNR